MTPSLANASEKEFAFRPDDFNEVRAKLKKLAGINLADTKDSMVYSRISRRIRHHGLKSFREYLEFLDRNAAEVEEFINALTTNLTSFFREPHHFEHLRSHIAAKKRLKIWCAAASTGEEPYSIAMTAIEALGKRTEHVEIVATDIDSKVLSTADKGIYDISLLDSLSLERKKRFFVRGKGPNSGKAKVRPELRQLITFSKMNLMDRDYSVDMNFDVIFCRNVMIYFDKATQVEILKKLLNHLKPDGLYYAGHSENFGHLNNLLKPLGKTIYAPKGRSK